MAYDRFDSRGGDRGRWQDDDHHERSYRGSGGGRDDRGFFERARDEVSSWFGDEDSGHRRMDDDRSSGRDNMNWGRSGSRESERGRFERDERQRYGSHQDRGMFGSGGESWGRDRDEHPYGRSQQRGGMFSHDEDRGRGMSRGDRDRGGMSWRDDGPEHGRSSFASRDHGRDDEQRSRISWSPADRPMSGDRDRYEGRSMRGGSGRDDGYRPMTGDYGRGGGGEGRQRSYRSGMGGQDFGRSMYGRQDFSQDQDSDRQYGRTYNYGGWGDRDSQQQSQRGSGSGDDHYSQWRQRQIQELDRDYDDYRREHQSKFENEFSGWRQQRQTKRQMLQSIREHMEVADQNGEHIGTVDCVKGDRIILTKSDPAAGGVHRSFSCSLLDRVEDRVYLTGTAATIRNQLHEEREDRGRDERGGGIFGGLFGGGRSDEDRRDDRSTTSNRPDSEGPHVLDRSFSGTYDDKK